MTKKTGQLPRCPGDKYNHEWELQGRHAGREPEDPGGSVPEMRHLPLSRKARHGIWRPPAPEIRAEGEILMKMVFEVEGSEEVVTRLVRLLAAMHLASAWGASRWFGMPLDGDGPERLKVAASGFEKVKRDIKDHAADLNQAPATGRNLVVVFDDECDSHDVPARARQEIRALTDLAVGMHIAVTSPKGKKACGKIEYILPRGHASFCCCRIPIHDFITDENPHLVEKAERCVS